MLVEQSIRSLSAKFHVSQVEVSREIGGDPEFSCVPSEMQQILTNLLNNAVEAMPGPGRIRVRSSASVNWADRGVRGVRITVADDGPGMPKETLERIAEPFFTTKGSSGTGLGMWVVTELVAKQNGRLSISSSVAREHHGTVVSIFIPLNRSSHGEHDDISQERRGDRRCLGAG
jgi:signal transduction histidine kinase